VKKKALALLCALALALGNVPAALALPATAFYRQFADTGQPAWGALIMKRMVQTGIMRGYQGTGASSDTYYAYPDQPVTRDEFAVLLARSLNLPDSTTVPPLADWADIPAWAQPKVATLFTRHVVQGQPGPDGGSYFDGGAYITRAELVAMIERAAGASTGAAGPSPFYDVTSQDWFYGYVLAAYRAGIVQGEEPGWFEPYGNATRVEVMAMLWRLLTGAKTGVPPAADLIQPVETVNNLTAGALQGQKESRLASYLTGEAALALSQGNFFLLENTPPAGVVSVSITYPAGQPQVVAESVYLATVAATVEVNLGLSGSAVSGLNYQGVVYYRLINQGGQWLVYAVTFYSQSVDGSQPAILNRNGLQDGGF